MSVIIKSGTRADIHKNYIRYSHDLKKLIGAELQQWVNGSFVTLKVNPKDIDFITFLKHEDIKRLVDAKLRSPSSFRLILLALMKFYPELGKPKNEAILQDKHYEELKDLEALLA